MRHILVITFIAFATAAEAQVIGHGVFGVGGMNGFVSTEPSFTAAGGVEFALGDRLGMGGEVGVFDSLIMLSAAATARGRYHRGFVPFVTGGVSRVGVRYGDGTFSTLDVGAGMDMWFRPRTAMRLEFVDHIRPDSRGTTQYWALRAGVVFK